MFSLQSSLVLTVLVPSVCSSLLSSLLQPTVRSASCQARCLNVPSDQLQDCLQICSLALEDPQTSICNYPRFCTGGCRAACQSERRQEVRLAGVSQEECLLSWRMEDKENQENLHHNVVFIVAGLDQGGMVSLVSEQQQESSLHLGPEMVSKYLELTVLAVDSEGLLDMETVLLQQTDNCPQHRSQSLSPSFIQENLTHLVLVMVIVIILLSFIIIKTVKSLKQQPVKKQILEDVYYSDKIFLVCQESLADEAKFLNLL